VRENQEDAGGVDWTSKDIHPKKKNWVPKRRIHRTSTQQKPEHSEFMSPRTPIAKGGSGGWNLFLRGRRLSLFREIKHTTKKETERATSG